MESESAANLQELSSRLALALQIDRLQQELDERMTVLRLAKRNAVRRLNAIQLALTTLVGLIPVGVLFLLLRRHPDLSASAFGVIGAAVGFVGGILGAVLALLREQNLHRQRLCTERQFRQALSLFRNGFASAEGDQSSPIGVAMVSPGRRAAAKGDEVTSYWETARWAAELDISDNPQRSQLGVAQLSAIARSEISDPRLHDFVRVTLQTVLEPVLQQLEEIGEDRVQVVLSPDERGERRAVRFTARSAMANIPGAAAVRHPGHSPTGQAGGEVAPIPREQARTARALLRIEICGTPTRSGNDSHQPAHRLASCPRPRSPRHAQHAQLRQPGPPRPPGLHRRDLRITMRQVRQLVVRPEEPIEHLSNQSRIGTK